MRELLFEIAESYCIGVEELEVSVDHVHIFCSFAPKYSITQVVTRFKSLSARAIFREHPEVKRQLWGGEFWEDGFVVGVGSRQWRLGGAVLFWPRRHRQRRQLF